jgi:hypothetical protein
MAVEYIPSKLLQQEAENHRTGRIHKAPGNLWNASRLRYPVLNMWKIYAGSNLEHGYGGEA